MHTILLVGLAVELVGLVVSANGLRLTFNSVAGRPMLAPYLRSALSWARSVPGRLRRGRASNGPKNVEGMGDLVVSAEAASIAETRHVGLSVERRLSILEQETTDLRAWARILAQKDEALEQQTRMGLAELRSSLQAANEEAEAARQRERVIDLRWAFRGLTIAALGVVVQFLATIYL